MNKSTFLPFFYFASLSSTAKDIVSTMELPNILIILCDDAGYGDFGFMGSSNTLTPNIDKLAQSGRFFTDFHMASTVSSPSRAMMLTGRYGQRFGYECNTSLQGQGLPEDEIIVSQMLKPYDYNTVCIGKWHLGTEVFQHPNNKGFDDFYGLIGGGRSYYYEPEKSDKPGRATTYEHNGKNIAFDGYFTDELTRQAVQYIEQDSDKPFFMYLSYTAPHSPNQALADDLRLFDETPRGIYAAMLYALDRGVGEVVQSLKRSGEYDNTIIFFASDNGGSTTNNSSNEPLKGFKGNKFEGGHRVPLIAVWGDRFLTLQEPFKGLSSSLDIVATIIDVVGVESGGLSKPIDGVSLLPYLMGDKSGDPHKELYWRKMDSRACRYEDYKIITTEGVDTVLYDLSLDLDEMHDLSKEQPLKLKQMLKGLDKWEQKYCIKPLWIENGWSDITNGYHRRLMSNDIKNADDLKHKR